MLVVVRLWQNDEARVYVDEELEFVVVVLELLAELSYCKNVEALFHDDEEVEELVDELWDILANRQP